MHSCGKLKKKFLSITKAIIVLLIPLTTEVNAKHGPWTLPPQIQPNVVRHVSEQTVTFPNQGIPTNGTTTLPPQQNIQPQPLSVPPTAQPPIIPQQDQLAKRAEKNEIKSGPSQIWNLKDADIRAVIEMVSIITGKNFIIDPRVAGKITLLSQKPMSPDEIYHVFLSLLEILNYAAVPSGHIIKIVPIQDAKMYGGAGLASRLHPGQGDEIVVRVIPVNDISATQLVPILRPLIQDSGTISAYAPSNTIILAGLASNIQRLVEIIRNMDNPSANLVNVITLKNANAQHVVKVINELESARRAEGATTNYAIAADPENNSILVSGTPNMLYRMKMLIKRLDMPGQGLSYQTIVVHLSYLTAGTFAPILQKIATGEIATLSAKTPEGIAAAAASAAQAAMASNSENEEGGGGIGGKISIEAEKTTNSLIIRAPRELIKGLRSVIYNLDIRPAQVLVEAMVVRINQTLLDRLGIIWGTADHSGNPIPLNGGADTFALKLNNGFGIINNGNLQALVSALRSDGSTNILATPSEVVLNNQEAIIKNGQNIGILNRQYPTDNNNGNQVLTFNTFQRQDVALVLKVTPQITPGQTLRLKLSLENNTVEANASTTTSDNPTINISEIDTSVLVRSGDILVLGGLINDTQTKTVQKIPLLGDIPGLGHLFRYDTHNMQKQDLMIFIRPVILRGSYQSNRQTISHYDYMRNQQMIYESGKPLSSDDLPIMPPIHREQPVLLPPPSATDRSASEQ